VNNTELSFPDFVKLHKNKAIVVVSITVFLLTTIGLQNAPYNDDSSRRLSGNTGWAAMDGRLGNEFSARLLNQGYPLVDLGITTFVITGLVMAAVSLLLAWALVGHRASWVAFLLASAISVNPWILGALAFRFDGPFMALSVLAAASSTLWYRKQLRWVLAGYAITTFLTPNFYQPTLGIIVMLLFTQALLDWVLNGIAGKAVLKRIGYALAGCAVGGIIYFLQISISGHTRGGWDSFDIQNPLARFWENLTGMISAFISDSTLAWLLFMLLSGLLGVVMLLRQSKLQLWKPLVIAPVYLALCLVAAGGVMLFGATNQISTRARYMFPLAFLVSIWALIASRREEVPGEAQPLTAVRLTKSLSLITSAVLLVFTYLWLSFVPIFAQALGEQQTALRTQAATIFTEVFSHYQGEHIVIVNPEIFENSVYLQRAVTRFPIFRNPYYVRYIDQGDHHAESQLLEILNLPRDFLLLTEDPTFCPSSLHILGDENEITRGLNWVAWRPDGLTICVTPISG